MNIDQTDHSVKIKFNYGQNVDPTQSPVCPSVRLLLGGRKPSLEAESDLSPGEDVTSLGLDYLPGDVTLS